VLTKKTWFIIKNSEDRYIKNNNNYFYCCGLVNIKTALGTKPKKDKQ